MQVFDSFGLTKAPSTLFLDYGFADIQNSMYNRCTLPWSSLGEPEEASNRNLLETMGIQMDSTTFEVRMRIANAQLDTCSIKVESAC